MKLKWFRRSGIFYVPVSVIGWLILLAAMGLAVYFFIDIDSRSHSASDTLINFVFYLLIIGCSLHSDRLFDQPKNLKKAGYLHSPDLQLRSGLVKASESEGRGMKSLGIAVILFYHFQRTAPGKNYTLFLKKCIFKTSFFTDRE